MPSSSTSYLIVWDDEVDGLLHDDSHKGEDEGFVNEEEGPHAHPDWSSGFLKFPPYIPAIPSQPLVILLSPWLDDLWGGEVDSGEAGKVSENYVQHQKCFDKGRPISKFDEQE